MYMIDLGNKKIDRILIHAEWEIRGGNFDVTLKTTWRKFADNGKYLGRYECEDIVTNSELQVFMMKHYPAYCGLKDGTCPIAGYDQ